MARQGPGGCHAVLQRDTGTRHSRRAGGPIGPASQTARQGRGCAWSMGPARLRPARGRAGVQAGCGLQASPSRGTLPSSLFPPEEQTRRSLNRSRCGRDVGSPP